jgi:hypothetical protein
MKAKELIYNLRTNLQAAGSQLSEATDQHVMYMLDSARSVLAAQKLDAGVNIIQMSQAVDITPIKATTGEIGSIGSSKVLKLVIPKPVSYMNGSGIFTIGPTDGQESYTEISFSQLRTALHRKYTGASPKWFELNGEIFVINVDFESGRKMRVRGVFDEPYKVEVLMGRYKHLDPFNFEYPATLKDAKVIYQLAMAADLGWGDTAVGAINAAQAKQAKGQQLITALQGATKQED